MDARSTGDGRSRTRGVHCLSLHTERDLDQRLVVAEALAQAMIRVDPILEPAAILRTIQHPVHILHGRNDALVPFTESLRLQSILPEGVCARTAITRLFGHSAGVAVGTLHAFREVPGFLRALMGVLNLV